MHLVGFTTELYYDAQSYKCEIYLAEFIPMNDTATELTETVH